MHDVNPLRNYFAFTFSFKRVAHGPNLLVCLSVTLIIAASGAFFSNGDDNSRAKPIPGEKLTFKRHGCSWFSFDLR